MSDEAVDFDAMIAELEVEDDSVPQFVKDVDAGQKDTEGRAAHAFADQKRKNKQFARLVRDQQRKLNEMESNQRTSNPPPNAKGAQGNAGLILQTLKTQAITNLGLTSEEEAPEMVALEMQRLYNEGAAQAVRIQTAQAQAPAVIKQVLASIPQLGDDDRAEVEKRVSKLTPLQQVDEESIKWVVNSYVGEKVMRGEELGSTAEETDDARTGAVGGDDGVTPPVESETPATDRTAVGSLKNTGSKVGGVKPGIGHPGKKAGPQPATPEELKKMRSLGMTDLAAYRAALGKKDKYKS